MPKHFKPPAFLLYVDDFACDGKVEAMTTEEVGAYILLLLKAWHEDPPGTVPNNDLVLARWARLTPERWAECKPAVLAAFRLGVDNRWHQKRMRLEYEILQTSKKRRAAAAKSAAEVRWGQLKEEGNANRIANASESHPDGNADAMRKNAMSSSSSNSNTTPTSTTAREDEFIDPSTHWSVQMYVERYGELPPITAQELMAATVKDREVWKSTLMIWKGNGHNEQRYGNLLDRYERELAKKQVRNGQKIVGNAAPKPGKYDKFGK